jgi:hypothetical protein
MDREIRIREEAVSNYLNECKPYMELLNHYYSKVHRPRYLYNLKENTLTDVTTVPVEIIQILERTEEIKNKYDKLIGNE